MSDKYWAAYTENGKVFQVSKIPDYVTHEQISSTLKEGSTLLEIDENQATALFNIQPHLQAFIDDKGDLVSVTYHNNPRTEKKQEVSFLKLKLREKPITYGQVPFDADERSQGLITGLILRLERGDGLPIGWGGWRDKENVFHWENDTAEVVLDHMKNIAGLIENREQYLFSKSIEIKNMIDSMIDDDEVFNLEITELLFN